MDAKAHKSESSLKRLIRHAKMVKVLLEFGMDESEAQKVVYNHILKGENLPGGVKE
jgi:hypothetical protein